jgi:multicomponent Na+:H+ antiporter subunit G
MNEWRLFAGDLLALTSCAATTLAIAGTIRLPDAFAKIHAASKAVVLGAQLMLLACIPAGEGPLIFRALLVALLLLLTAPIGSNALGRLEARLREEGRE